MKRLEIFQVEPPEVKVENLSKWMDGKSIPFHSLNEINWKEFPYRPDVKFRISYSPDAILINYQVEEKSIRARYENDNGAVWTDSCVEFFIMPENDGIYYNIEFNCIGTMLIGAGAGRGNRERASQELLDQVQRWSSLGNETIPLQDGNFQWELAAIIPLSSFYKHTLTSLKDKKVRGNFYKCGDELATPHFVSWNKIEVESPDFHRPEFFGELDFK